MEDDSSMDVPVRRVLHGLQDRRILCTQTKEHRQGLNE